MTALSFDLPLFSVPCLTKAQFITPSKRMNFRISSLQPLYQLVKQ